MRTLAAALLLAGAGCVSITTRATIELGAGGRGELVVSVDQIDTLVVTNSGDVPVEMSAAVEPETGKPTLLAPGASTTLRGGRYRLTFANHSDRQAIVQVVGSGTPHFMRP